MREKYLRINGTVLFSRFNNVHFFFDPSTPVRHAEKKGGESEEVVLSKFEEVL